MTGLQTQPHRPDLHGILVIDKPDRMSSMTAVSIIRRKAGGAKAGHAGTLDPLATGVLVVAIGKATRFINRFMATSKRYDAAIDLSAFTSTDDLEGERTEISPAIIPSEHDVRDRLARFVGRIMQQPPAFSAMKVGGRRAYKLARQGQAVDLPERPVMVHSLDLISYEWPLVSLQIHCDKGFYVRSLARDLGRALGTGGHCTAIRRTAVGPFTIEHARQLDELPNQISQADVMDVEQAVVMIAAARS